MSTDLAPLTESHHPRRRMVFDPTVNLGHMLTFVGFLVAGFSAYSTLDKRVSVTEIQATVAIERMREQDSRMKETLTDIRRDVKDLQKSVNDVNRYLSSGPSRGG
ncbi:hypothetical protein [Delftia tsuruhatensis]|jgi:hypothetical protein|uniref:hypothetical protein n=1 Tax=Delftia tsuruhatensis TaxID=180282 RepID=UPI002027BA1E|nr:hypothetical protein [Delftia tsuruhatensis]